MNFHIVIQPVGFTGQLEINIDAETKSEAFEQIAEIIGQMKEND